MNQPDLEFLTVGEGAEARDIAYYYRPALDDSLDIVEPPEADRPETEIADTMEEAPSVTGLVWLGGFKSDMTGSKAAALDAYADIRGLSLLRFDYSGHGASKGEFLDGTISRWLEEAAAIVEHTSQFGDRLILAGSSMGGWIALLLNEVMKAKDDTASTYIDITGDIAGLDIASLTRPSVAGLVLVAPATDMTQDLMWAGMNEAERTQMQAKGQFARPNEYSDEPYIITKKLIDDGKKHLFGNTIIHTQCPVYILQGSKDNSVPPAHALKLASQLPLDDVVVSITPDGDHSLSRPQDLNRLIQTIDGMLYSS
ncbi:MAG: alpha/beta hydrolase [Hyphomicrobiales bacterium]|nr:MAG: alpha/beta hydrolase [Hyphomicrobiales bacterium]